ncbi:MAG: XRE family transcriptional regulator [Ammonifex sp.]|nr:MAG: XRE family transcriptional regulator [Ammonifex sp.]
MNIRCYNLNEVIELTVQAKLSLLMGQKQIRSIADLSRRSGIARTTLTTLWYGRAKGISFKTLNSLCKALDCQPGDLLVYVPDGDA